MCGSLSFWKINLPPNHSFLAHWVRLSSRIWWYFSSFMLPLPLQAFQELLLRTIPTAQDIAFVVISSICWLKSSISVASDSWLPIDFRFPHLSGGRIPGESSCELLPTAAFSLNTDNIASTVFPIWVPWAFNFSRVVIGPLGGLPHHGRSVSQSTLHHTLMLPPEDISTYWKTTLHSTSLLSLLFVNNVVLLASLILHLQFSLRQFAAKWEANGR